MSTAADLGSSTVPAETTSPTLTSQSPSSNDDSQGRYHVDRRQVREGDWLCTVCGANVFGRNISCFRCMTPKPGTNARHGDWVCLNKQCGAHNFAGRQTCFKCLVYKGAEKPGDWPCPNCHSNNFASRIECFRCHVPRPHGYAAVAYVNVRPGDWLCPNPTCGSNVFANRDSCFRCNTPRPADAEVASAFSNMRAGDWTCPSCNALCYANRQSCFQCETPRPDLDMHNPSAMHAMSQAYPGQYPFAYSMGYNPYANNAYFPPQYYQQPRGVIYGQGMVMIPYKRREGDWTCSKCAEVNFAKRHACYRCKCPRLESSPVVPEVSAEPAPKLSEDDQSVPAPSQSPAEVQAQ